MSDSGWAANSTCVPVKIFRRAGESEMVPGANEDTLKIVCVSNSNCVQTVQRECGSET